MEELGYAVLIWLVGCLIFIGGYTTKEEIESHQPIQPTLEITIENGVADTTYVYKIQ